jgi:DnaJ-class molecular chaperone
MIWLGVVLLVAIGILGFAKKNISTEASSSAWCGYCGGTGKHISEAVPCDHCAGSGLAWPQ